GGSEAPPRPERRGAHGAGSAGRLLRGHGGDGRVRRASRPRRGGARPGASPRETPLVGAGRVPPPAGGSAPARPPRDRGAAGPRDGPRGSVRGDRGGGPLDAAPRRRDPVLTFPGATGFPCASRSVESRAHAGAVRGGRRAWGASDARRPSGVRRPRSR